MKALAWLTLVALAGLAFFAVANWPLINETAPLSFLFFTAHGPLGLILLSVVFGFAALFAVYAVWLRTTALVETRRHLKELEAQRELAEKSEASRFTALSSQIEQEGSRVRASVEAARLDVLGRVEALENALSGRLDEAANTLAAHVGQVDDKLERYAGRGDAGLPPPAARS